MTSRVLMIRPAWFAYDEQTARSNAFQHRPKRYHGDDLIRQAQQEFQRLVGALDRAGVEVLVVDDRPDVRTPDSVFPNNWLSFHQSGHAVLYPMATPSRQNEVRPELIDLVEARTGCSWPERVDLTPLAVHGDYVEGTGSVVFDHFQDQAFACRSARTTESGLVALETALGTKVHRFRARDADGMAYYHTNVMMAAGETFAVVCSESIDAQQRDGVLEALAAPGRDVIEISRVQAAGFAGNILGLRSTSGTPLVAMSEQAASAFTREQRETLSRSGELVTADISTIERVGGGSARCMICEIHAPIDRGTDAEK